jgi:PAS domain-containing protein
MLVTTLEDGRIIDGNDLFFKTFDLDKKDSIGKTSVELNLISAFDRSRAMKMLESGIDIKSIEHKRKKKNGPHRFTVLTKRDICFQSL